MVILIHMYSYFNRKNISINLIINTQKVKLTNIKIDYLKLALSISLIFLFALNLSNNYNSMYVFGHSIFGNNNNGNTTQIQTNGNYKVELFTNPSKIPLNKPVDILLNFSVISSNGLQMMELPVYLSLAKDGELGNLQHTPIIISGGHYNFKTVFPEPGKYLLFVDVKDIYYTNSMLNFIFELNADVPFTDQFYNAMKFFSMDYYYIYLPVLGLIILIYLEFRKKDKTLRKIILIIKKLQTKLNK